jgi:hypothetical protein
VTDPLDDHLIGRHLRDCHGFSLAQSVERRPAEMRRKHFQEHEEAVCNHKHDYETTPRGGISQVLKDEGTLIEGGQRGE